MRSLRSILAGALLLPSYLLTPAMADTTLTDDDLRGAYTTISYSKRVVCHDPSIFMDTVTNGTPANPQYYIYGSHLGRGKTSAASQYRDWTSFKSGEENNGTNNSLFANVNDQLVNYSQAYSTHAVKRVRNCNGEEVDFGNFDAHQWQNSGYNVRGNQWAADAIWNRKMQKWCLYMSLNGDKWCSCIVCFTSDSPEGPWVYQGPVVYSGFNGATAHVGYGKADDYKHMDLELAIGTQDKLPQRYAPSQNYGRVWPNCIDPCVFYDEEGQLWMSYGSWSGGIFILRLNEENGLRDYEYRFPYEVNNKEVTPGAASENCTCDPYFGRKIAGGYYVSGEASYIEYINGYYYLFMSYGGLEAAGGYQMRVFRSEQPDGPYKDCCSPNGLSAIYSSYQLNFGGNAQRDEGVKIFGQYQWDPMSTAELAQGHNSAIVDHEGRALLVYHTRFNNGTEGHQVRVHQMFQNQDGWLVASPYEFGGETVNTVQACTQQLYTAEQVAGDYQFIAHPYRQATANKSYEVPVNITLQPDGTVTGAYTGSWELVSGTSFINITLKGTHTNNQPVEFRGVLTEQTIDYTDIKALCFTALSSSDGQHTAGGASRQTRALSVWGSKADTKAAIKYALDKQGNTVRNNSTVTKALDLPTVGKMGCNIEWTSSNPDILTDDGKLKGKGTVTLTMTIRKDGHCYSRDYTLNVDGDATPETPVYYPECGATNNSAAWWTAFSDLYQVDKEQSAEFRFYNYNSGGNNWDNWLLVCTNGKDSHGGGGTEYFVIRADAYGWGNGNYNANNIQHDFDWNTFVSDMNGALVDVVVSYSGSRVDVKTQVTTQSGKQYSYSYWQSGITAAPIGIFFTVEKSHISETGPNGEHLGIHAVTADAADGLIFDLFGRVIDQPREGLNIINGRKVIIR